jgi:formamidopyrimidine-DNA glycosylase
MPELPEVETIRRDIEKEFVNHRIKKVEVSGARSIRRHKSAKEFTARVEGRKLVGTRRRGKYLLMRLDNGEVLVVHLGMSGQLLRVNPKEGKSKHTHVVLTFVGAPDLRFVDPRTFGEVFVTTPDQLESEVPELAHLGFDPLEEQMAWTLFGEMLINRRAKLKPLLMDQRFVAGIGNMYADEILFAAGLRYDRLSNSLSSQEVRRLYRAMVETLAEAVKRRGSSLADEQYRDLFGEVGDYQDQHQAYDREGQACRRCRATIVKVKSGGRSTYFCDHCQV